jgi:hypothetical protein
LKARTISGYQRLNALILRIQEVTGGWYEKYFTMYAALLFSMTAGACMGFTGDNCYGKIPFDSPVFYCLLLIAIFFLFQTFLLIPLTGGRLLRLLTVAVCGHYLAYQGYGFWSMHNIDQIALNLSNVPAHQISSLVYDSSMLDMVNGENVCKPYAYANIPYGHFWILGPAAILIGICFWGAGNENEN